VDDLVVERDGAVAAIPSGGGGAGVIGFEIENAFERRAALRAAENREGKDGKQSSHGQIITFTGVGA
jgi:hypothetical protein